MEQKIKIAIIGLVVLLFVSFLIILGTMASKHTLEREIEQLSSERSVLRKQADDIALQKRQLEERFNSLNSDMRKVSQEKNDLQGKYDLVDKAREDLLAQIKALKEKPAAAPSYLQQPVSVASVAPVSAPPAADAYWGGILQAKTDLEFQLTAVRSEMKNLQISNEQLQREKTNLQMDITTLSRDSQDLRRQMEYNQKVMDSVTAELVREKNDKSIIQESVKTIKVENSTLKRQIKALSGRKIVLERKLAEIQEKNSGLEKRFDEVEVLLKDKMSQVENIKTQVNSSGQQKAGSDSVELPAITVRPQEDAASAQHDVLAAYRGRIAAVNRDNNFVVIDIGQDTGVNVGDAFQVYRDDKLIAKLETIQVRQNIAACDIKKELSPVKVGDSIR
jgi:predicted nuclease with TOPRIM domain